MIKIIYPYYYVSINNITSVKHFHSTRSNKMMDPKIVGENKHYPPSIKEWSNSTYTFNKNFMRNIPYKDIMAYKTIKNYFYLSNCKGLARSRRMRSLIRKSGSNRIFVSKPEIKQTNDKVAINIYIYNRKRLLLLKKLYYNIRKLEKANKKALPYVKLYNTYENWRSRYSVQNNLTRLHSKIFNINNNSHKYRNLKYKYFMLKKKNMYFNRRYLFKNRSILRMLRYKRKNSLLYKKNKINRKKAFKKGLHYSGIKLTNESLFLRYATQLKKNILLTRKWVLYKYMKLILSLLNIHILNFDKLTTKNIDDNKIAKINSLNRSIFNGDVIFFVKGSNKFQSLSINSIQGNLSYIDKVNTLIFNFLNKVLNTYKVPKEKSILIDHHFSKINFEKLLSTEYESNTANTINNFKKEIMLTNHYIDLKINNYLLGNYLPALKLVISKIYNKKTELNITSLKYPYLNTEVYTDIIANKLKRKVGMSRVINGSLRLVKMPFEFEERPNMFKTNSIQKLNIYKSLSINNLYKNVNTLDTRDKIEYVLNKMYPRPMISKLSYPKIGLDKKDNIKYNNKEMKTSTKVISVLNNIKYKWVSGVRLEASGRLTRRYTAARSAYKCKYRGSLKDIDYSRKLDYLNRTMPVILMRNQVKANSDYSFKKSKRRIGAFGVKGWISGY